MSLSALLSIFKRLRRSMAEDYISLIAAGVAFYFLMAAFPALAALISLYGIFSDPYFVTKQLDLLQGFLPPTAFSILADQALTIASSNAGTLSFSFAVSVLFSIYSATKGMQALIKGLNIAYDRQEKRNILVLNLSSFGLTFVMMIYLLIALTLVAAVPVFLNMLPAAEEGWVASFFHWFRWIFLFGEALVGLQILYRYGPSGMPSRGWWMSWGGCAATLMWIGTCSLFSLFISNFGRYNETYGSLGAVILLLLWLWMSALTVLIGAELNAAIDAHRKAKPPVCGQDKKEALC